MQLHEVLTLPAHHDQIQPLSRCPGCAQIYWPGSHVDEMLQLLA
jgi:uncharacterized protein with PIN domain